MEAHRTEARRATAAARHREQLYWTVSTVEHPSVHAGVKVLWATRKNFCIRLAAQSDKNICDRNQTSVCVRVCECVTRSSDQTRVHLVRAVQTGPKLYSLQFLWKIKTYNCLWKKENKKQQKKRTCDECPHVDISTSPMCVFGCARFFFLFFFQCVCMFHFLNFCLFFFFFLLMFQPSSRGGRRVSQREKKRNLTRFSLSYAFLRDKWWNFSFSPCLIGLLSYSLHIFHSFSSF